jgi:serine phosphatase RsbU (regulator of sigma subunit)
VNGPVSGDTTEILARLVDVLGEGDERALVLGITQLAVELTGAEFGMLAPPDDDAAPTVVGPGTGFLEHPDARRAPLLGSALNGGGALRIDDVTRWAPSDEAARPYGTFGDGRRVRSYVACPVHHGGGARHGALLLGHHEPRAFEVSDERLVEVMAAHLAVALDNARVSERQARIATSLQETLLPPLLPTIPFVDIAARYRATGAGNLVGGDFYDVFETGDGTWGVVLGDVAGVGPEAAALTGLARYTVRAVARHQEHPCQVMAALNEALCHRREDERFCTAVYLRFVPTATGVSATLASGGHPQPLILRDAGRVEAAPTPGGMLLGLFPDAQFGEESVNLGPGDALVLYTDGVIEARTVDGEQFGEERLAGLLDRSAGRTADGIARRVELTVIDHQGGTAGDDVAVVVIRALPGPPTSPVTTGRARTSDLA